MVVSSLLFIVVLLGVGLIAALALLVYVNDLAKKKKADDEKAAAAKDLAETQTEIEGKPDSDPRG